MSNYVTKEELREELDTALRAILQPPQAQLPAAPSSPLQGLVASIVGMVKQSTWKQRITAGSLTLFGLLAISAIASNKPGQNIVSKIPGLHVTHDEYLDATQGEGSDRLQQEMVNRLSWADSQIAAAREQLLAKEAFRYQVEADKQIKDAQAPCFRLELNCVYDQFQNDALGMMNDAQQADRPQEYLNALVRWESVELARQGQSELIAPEYAKTRQTLADAMATRQEFQQTTNEAIARSKGGED